jgi:hypothetical protein
MWKTKEKEINTYRILYRTPERKLLGNTGFGEGILLKRMLNRMIGFGLDSPWFMVSSCKYCNKLLGSTQRRAIPDQLRNY